MLSHFLPKVPICQNREKDTFMSITAAYAIFSNPPPPTKTIEY